MPCSRWVNHGNPNLVYSWNDYEPFVTIKSATYLLNSMSQQNMIPVYYILEYLIQCMS